MDCENEFTKTDHGNMFSSTETKTVNGIPWFVGVTLRRLNKSATIPFGKWNAGKPGYSIPTMNGINELRHDPFGNMSRTFTRTFAIEGQHQNMPA
jgi:hypothetical protein